MRRIRIAFLIIFIFIFVAACEEKEKEHLSLEEIAVSDSASQTENKDTIFVYVCGAVHSEGVYELPAGSRVYEAISMAGGMRDDAATEAVNQAEVLEDEAQLYIPTIEEVKDSQSAGNGKININKASKEQLMTLPGVGEAKADIILQYRNENGPFRKIEDIMNISGIKEGLFAKIKDLITI